MPPQRHLCFARSARQADTTLQATQRWLEHYVKQTSIPVWIYLAIVAVMALMIVLCVGWQVYKTSIENPADALHFVPKGHKCKAQVW